MTDKEQQTEMIIGAMAIEIAKLRKLNTNKETIESIKEEFKDKVIYTFF